MTIKDKRDAVVEAAKAYAAAGGGGHARSNLVGAVEALEAAETPLKLEGVVLTRFHGLSDNRPDVELRGNLATGTSLCQVAVTVRVRDSADVVEAFRRSSGSHRFRIVLTEIMDGET